MNDDFDFVSESEASRRTGATQSAIANYVRDGYISAVKMSGRVFVFLPSLVRFLDAHEITPRVRKVKRASCAGR